MLKQDKDGYYLVDSVLDLKQYHRLTDLTMREKIQLRAELNPTIVKKQTPKKKNASKKRKTK